MLLTLIIPILSVIIGGLISGLITWLCSRHYYLKASRELLTETIVFASPQRNNAARDGRLGHCKTESGWFT